MGGYTSRPNFAAKAAPLPETSTIYTYVYTKWYIFASQMLFLPWLPNCVCLYLWAWVWRGKKDFEFVLTFSPWLIRRESEGCLRGMSLTEVPQMPQIELGLTPSLWSLWRKRRQWQIHGIDKDKQQNKSCALGTISVDVNKRDLGETKKHYYASKVSKKTNTFFGH